MPDPVNVANTPTPTTPTPQTTTEQAGTAASANQASGVRPPNSPFNSPNVSVSSNSNTTATNQPNTSAESYGLPSPVTASTANLLLILQQLRSQVEQSQLQTSQSDVEATRLEQREVADQRLEQLQEQVDSIREANNSSKIGKIFGWIAAAATLIAGALLVATGVATAVGVGLLITGAALLTVQILNETGAAETLVQGFSEHLQEAYGLPEEAALGIVLAIYGTAAIFAAVNAGVATLNPGVGLAVLATFLSPLLSAENLETLGVSEDVAPWLSLGIGVGLGVAAAGAGIATAYSEVGRAAAKAVHEVVQSALSTIGAQVAGRAGQIGAVAGFIATGVAGGAAIAQGGTRINASVLQGEASEAQAASQELEAILVALQQFFQDQGERIEEIIRRIDESVDILAQVIRQDDTTNEQIVNFNPV